MKKLLSFLPMSAAKGESVVPKMGRLLSILTLMPVLMLLSATPLFSQNRFYPKAINIEPGTSESIEFVLDNAADFYGFQANVTLPSGLSFAKNDTGKLDITLNAERCDGSYQCVTNMVSGVLHLGVFSFASPQPAIQGTGGTVVTIRVDASESFRGGTVKLTDIKFVDKNDRDVNLTNTSAFIGVLPVSITLSPDQVSLLRGIDGSDTANLTVIYEPDCEALVRDVTWISADEDVASVTATGVVAAVADEGTTVITATTINGKTATCDVDVSTPLEGLKLVPESITMEKGSTETFTVNILPPTASGVNIKWSTSDGAVATIGDIDPVKGETAGITAVSDGDAVITVEDGEFTSTSQVTVVTSPQRIDIAPVGDLYIAHPITMEATIYPEDASKIFTDQFKWSSSDESVATIDEFGNVMPLALGQTTISATVPTLTGEVVQTYVITVVPITVESLTIDPTFVELWVNRTATITATVLPEDAADKTVKWTSADPTIATVDENGVITAVALGETIVTASCQVHSAECRVSVVPTPAESLAVTPETAELLAGETLQLNLDVTPADADITWSSSNPSIATVDENGLVTAIYKGVATITATSVNGKTATCEVTVLIPAVSIILDKSEMTMERGTTSTIAATVDPIYTSDETIWTSSNEEIATVTNGVVTALNAGETVITATCGNVTAICKVTVIISPTGILLDKDLITKYVGETDKLTETVIPEDATDKTVTWRSSNESIVTVDQNGNIVAVALGEAVVTVTCGDYSAGCKVVVIPTPASRVDLDVTGAELRVGETVTLTPTVYPDDTTDKTVTWQSADESIATVDAYGVVTAVNLGEVMITASCGPASAECKITVVRTPVTAISLTNTELLLKEGESSDINEIVYPANATDKSVTWTSADPSIASVDAYGNVTGVAGGTTIITCTSVSDPDVTATCKVIVEPLIYEVTGLVISDSYLNLIEDDTYQLTATVTPENATDKTITWESSNPAIATVDANGLVTAIAGGECIIYASSSNGLTERCHVTVTPKVIDAASVALSNYTLTLTEGDVTDLLAIVLPVDTTDPSVTWSSSSPDVASVDPQADNKVIINALKPGVTSVTATTHNGLQATCVVTVIPRIIAVEGITLNKDLLEMIIADEETLIATITPDDATDKTVTWKSADTAIATVDADGKVTATGVGTTIIYASTSNGLTAQCTVIVSKGEVPVERISLTNTDLTMHVGDVTDLTAIVIPDDATDKTLTWSIADAEIASVDPEGDNKAIVTALKIGTTTITIAATNGVQSFCTVNVIPIQVESISIKESMTMTVGDEETLVATILPENATDKTVTWRSSDRSIATVDADGKVTAVAPGVATIYASSSNGLTAECVVTVEKGFVDVESISLTNYDITMRVGEVTDIVAMVRPDDATDKTITWQSADEEIATVTPEGDNKGIITAMKIGDTTITITATNGVTATCTVHVIPIQVESISIKESMTMTVGDEETLVATILPENATDKTVTWRSSDRSIATVDADGKVTAVAPGVATIYASSSNGLTAECVVTVEKGFVEVESISLTNYDITMRVGEVTDIVAMVRPDDATDKSVTWKSADEEIATVTPEGENKGIITAMKIGDTTITITATNGVTATCTVHVIPIQVESISIKESMTMTVGDEETLVATILPENATDKTVTWRSSDPSIATVDADGKVTAIAPGTAIIYASSSNGLTAECVVTVEKGFVDVESISLTNTEVTIRQGRTIDITAIIRPDDADDKTVTWTVADDAIATISPAEDLKCFITGVQLGTTVVTATSANGKTATCTVYVIPVAVEGISLNKTHLDMIVGDTDDLIATITPDDATDKTVTWRSADRTIATVDENGHVIAVGVGETTIYASASNGMSAECTVTVSKGIVEAASVTLTNTELHMFVGEVTDITAIILPEDTDDKTVTWTSANPAIASAEAADGLKAIITANAEGTAVVTVTTANGLQATCTVYVEPNIVAVTGISLDKDHLDMIVGDEDDLVATITPDDATDKSVTWKSNDPSIATVDANGHVTAVSPGVTTIFASSSNGQTAECVVTVTKGTVEVESISLTNYDITMRVGDVTDIVAMVRPDDATDKSVTWKSADEEIATVTPEGDNKGIITAMKIGDTTITITATNGVTATCTVHVIPIQVESISIKESLEMIVGDTETLIATILPENATDKTVTWRSSDRSIATVDENGLVTAIAPGTATIYASSSNGLTAECHVTVSKGIVEVESISLTNTEVTIRLGRTIDITAIIRPDDADDKTVTWTITDDAIATINPAEDLKCFITGVQLGTTVITATSANGKTATCTVYVIPVAVEGISIDKDHLDMIVGDEDDLVATITPDDATDKTITWKSADKTIAEVDENGHVTAMGVGETIIYASASNGMSAMCTVTVSKGTVEVESISLTNSELTIRQGRTVDITAIIRPDDADDKTVTWSNSDPAIASIAPGENNKCFITGLELGTTTVTATSVNGKTAICQVTVIPVVVEGISLNKEHLDMLVGDEETLIATITPDDATDKSVTWKSADKTIAEVDENGNVTAIGVGETTIYASASNGMSAMCTVTVARGDVPVESISLTNSELIMRVGHVTDIIAIVRPDDATDKTLTWTNADDAIISMAPDAEANNKVIITALQVGTTFVTATSANGVQAICKVTVIPDHIHVEDITLNKTKMQMTVGDLETLLATITPDDATDKTVTWRSSNPAIAAVDADGQVSALSVGVATIYASSSNGKTAECEVTVVPGVVLPTGITLTNTELLMREGFTADITALISPADATDKTVVWTNSDPAIATIDPDGDKVIISALHQGVTIITAATVNDLRAICTVTVVPVITAVEGIEVIPPTLELKVGQSDLLTALITPDEATDKTVTWETSDLAVAAVSADGEVTGIAPGQAIIYASSSNGLTAECRVTVTPDVIPVNALAVNPVELTLLQGQTAIVSAIITPDDATDRTITWSAADPAIASVDNGIVSAINPGVTLITARAANGLSADCRVTVIERPLTPKQLLRKGDGSTSTFVVMMPISDEELTAKGYSFVYGYTDLTTAASAIIAETPLRYAHAEPDIYNDPNLDFWVFAVLQTPDGVLCSNLRHLDGREEICFDPSIYGYSGSRTDADQTPWIRVTKSKAYITAAATEPLRLTFYTTSGSLVISKTYPARQISDVIDLTNFRPGTYIVTLAGDDSIRSTKIVVRDN